MIHKKLNLSTRKCKVVFEVYVFKDKRHFSKAIRDFSQDDYDNTSKLMSYAAMCIGKWGKKTKGKNPPCDIIGLFFLKPVLESYIVHEMEHVLQFAFPHLYARIAKDVTDNHASEVLAELCANGFIEIRKIIPKDYLHG